MDIEDENENYNNRQSETYSEESNDINKIIDNYINNNLIKVMNISCLCFKIVKRLLLIIVMILFVLILLKKQIMYKLDRR